MQWQLQRSRVAARVPSAVTAGCDTADKADAHVCMDAGTIGRLAHRCRLSALDGTFLCCTLVLGHEVLQRAVPRALCGIVLGFERQC